MHRKAITALTLACAMVVTPAVAATPAAAAAKPSYRGCYDGKCKFTFSKAVSFRISAKRYGFSRVYVSKEYVGGIFNQDMVVVRGPGSTASLGEGARGNMRINGKNALSFRVLAITSKGATIRFTG
ncbi:hypothetical protein [Nonomuraea diastatica]|uniref:Uncharacterized protein n=1 Tax=Nonomuraea diastatica TaxID=1848329 RepID=A0A4R4W4E2_9ACTN|nr:hypothetical protein [Nonomuraea diastatica]TDD13459.1 hypothetical protein E1294_40885 [Nonomuraea diastatica]